MRAVLQRVREARVEVSGEVVGEIGRGLLVLLGISRADNDQDALYLLDRILKIRIFTDSEHRMNRSLLDVGGSLLVVSQFTLFADCRQGRRPSFDQAAPAEQAQKLYEFFVAKARDSGIHVQTGTFRATMDVYSINEGPVTLICESLSSK